MLKLGKLHIHPSFIVVLIVALLTGYIKLYLPIVLATTLHELAHVAVARLFGRRADAITITPVGEIADISGMDSVCYSGKFAILAAGPMMNFVIAAVILCANISSLHTFAWVNASIGLFNLLPIYPFDGGRLVYLVLGNALGVLRCQKFVIGLSDAVVAILLVLGLLQVILHPFNISIITIAAFLRAISRKERAFMTFAFYRCVLQKGPRIGTGLSAHTVAVLPETLASAVMERITWDRYMIVHVVKDGAVAATFTEGEIFRICIDSAGE